MKRLSLLLVACAFLTTASGCCCGLFHGGGCNSCGYPSSPCGCGYAPAYQPYPAAPSCPTCPGGCPSGGCGVNGPMIQQGAFYDGDSMNRAAVSSNAGYGATPAASLAAAEHLSTY